MTLTDTSVWIDFLAGRNTPQVNVLESLIEQREELCLCGVVLTEILQGICDQEEYIKTESNLSNLILLPVGRETFVSAANIYRLLRARGATIRNSVDCMIAAVCIEHQVRLLHNDRDFDLIARYIDPKVV
jgi:predicted nucleic acid-binding protein